MSPEARLRLRRSLTFALRIAFTMLLLWLVARSVDFNQISDGWQHNLGSALLISFLLLLATLALSAVRWVIVSKVMGLHLQIGSAAAIVFVGHFFNQLLPTSFGGDAIRGWYLWRRGMTLQQAFMSVLFDRLMGVSALFLLLIAGLPVLAVRLNSAAPIILALAIVLGGIIGLLVLFNLHRFPPSMRRLRIWSFAERLAEYTRRMLAAPLQSAVAMAFSLVIHAMALYSTAILSDALGAPLSMLDALLVVPTVLVISALPVSIGGWGVREAGLAGGFALLGLPPAIAVTASVLLGVINLVGGMIGGLVFAVIGGPRKPMSDDVS